MRKDTQAETHSAKALRRLAASAAVLLAVCLVLMTPVSAVEPDTGWPGNSGGNGLSEETAYIISDTADLLRLVEMVSDIRINPPPNPTPGNPTFNPFTGKYIKLNDDIDLAEDGIINWVPIGLGHDIQGNRAMFNGTFIGNGKTISGLNINDAFSYAGLFGYIGPGGSVSGLTVEGSIVVDSTINQDPNAPSQPIFVGGIAGWNEGRISDSAFLGFVSATTNSQLPAFAGGIAGYNQDGIIANCYTTGDVSATSPHALASAGGIVGYNCADSGSASILNCYATGAVTANGDEAVAGGIAGTNLDGTVNYCYALSEAVSTTGSYAASAARVAGYSVTYDDTGSANPLSPGTNNYGWKHMTVNNALVTDSQGDYLNATGICAVQILSASWDSTNIWTMTGSENYKLPVLNGHTKHPESTPAHLLVTVTFNANGGTPTPTSQKVLDGALVTEPTGVVKTGYTLEGWYTEENFQNKWVFTAIVCPPDFPLYANWTLTSSQGGDEGTGGSGGNGAGGDDTGGDNTGTSGEPDEDPANNNNGGGGGGSEGTYDTYPRNTDENGDAGFGKSPVVIRIDLPEGTETAVTLITNPETPETPDTEDTDVYYEFELDIPDYPEETEGDVIWRIPKSLLNDEFGADDYGVYVYDEDEWKPLDSVWEEGDGNYLHYTTKITGDGNFIIVKEKGISKKAGDDTPVVTPGDEPQDTPGTVLPPSSGTETPDDETEIPILGIGIGLLILVLVIAGIVFAVSRRK